MNGNQATADLSVVICSLNGAAGVDRCLRALAEQKDVELQVIVVDDGSTDDTSAVAASHDVTVIRHAVNRGLAAARNTGIAAATAPVVAFLDDDCEPEPTWARQLLDAYEDGVIGVGGDIVPCGPEGFMLGYLRRNNPLLPLELNLLYSEKLLYRLYLYLLRQWRPEERHDKRDVYSLVGANMSFVRSALQEKGFDERFRFGAEDLDLCLRLPRDYPGARLVVTPDAVVRHHFVPSLRDTLRRSRSYGRGDARLYRKWPSMRPTVFPGPVLVAALLAASIAFPVLLVAVLAVPLLLYPKGLRLAVTLRNLACVLDSYVQLAEEAYGNVGYLQGLWTYRHLVPEPASTSADADKEFRHPGAAPAAGLVLLAALTPLHGSWAVQLLLVPLLLILPGIVLLRALRVPGESIAAYPVYVPAASLVVLLFSGLAIDLAGPRFGIAAPLEAAPLLITLEIVCLALLACSRGAPPQTRIPWSLPARPVTRAWPLLVPLLSAAGALRLNSGHSAAVADLAVVVVAIAAIAGFLFASRCDDSLLMIGIFALGLAMMWSFSLRGDLVYGFDISSEYYSMQQTVTAGVWHLSHPGDAYSAMLSLTVLPAELHALSGMPALLIFKVVYPVTAALFPVAVFNLARRMLTARWSYLAAALVLMQQTFFQQMPALARQEIATLLFAALLIAVLDTAQSRRTRLAFVTLLSLGVVVSHYSTAYLAITLLGIWIVFQFAASWFTQVPRLTGAALLACVVCTASAAVWYGPLTHSASNISQFVETVEGQGLELLPSQGGSNLLQTYLQGESNQQMTPTQYQTYTSTSLKQNDQFITPLPDATERQYALKPAPSQDPPVTSQLGNSVTNLASLLVQQGLNVLAGVGALVLALQRKAKTIVRQIGLLGLAAMVILILTRVSDTIAQEYNPERAFLQMTIVLGIGVCWMFQPIGRRWKVTRPLILAGWAMSFGAFFAVTSGIAGVAFGGGTAANLADSGSDYQEFVKTAPDLAAAAWVNQSAPPGQFIYADNYAELLLETVAGDRSGIFDAIAPETLDQHAWVYATSTNLRDNIVRAMSGSESSAYAFPNGFLTSNYNLVYTNGSSEVFHR